MTAIAGFRSARVVGISVRAWRAADIPVLAVWVASAAGFAWMLLLGLRRVDGLTTSAFDQAYFTQLAWSIGHGLGFRSSFNPGSFLGLHFSPLLVVPAVLELAWPDQRVLTILQAGALALATPAAFAFLRVVLRPAAGAAWMAAALTVFLPVWPIMQQQVRADFHTESLALPLVFLAGWAGLTRRIPLMAGAAILALMAKEDQVFPVALMALLVVIRAPGRVRAGPRRAGLALLAGTVLWAILLFAVVKPLLRAGATYDIDAYYAWLGGGLGVLRAPFAQTDAVVHALTRPDGWIVAGWLLAGLAGLAVLRPRWLALVVPPVVAHLLSAQIPQHEIRLQYGLLLVVPAVVAAGMGGRRLLAILARRRRRRRDPGRSRGPRVRLAVLALPALVAAFQAGAVIPFSQLEHGYWDRPPAIERVRSIAALVPADARLSVDWSLAPPLAARRDIALLPAADPEAYVLVDRRPYLTGFFPWNDRPAFVTGLERSGRPLLADDGRFRLWGPLP